MSEKISVGQATETSKRQNLPGIYVLHRPGLPDVRQAIANHPKFGSSLADAFVRVGFVFEREAAPEELISLGFAPDVPKVNPASPAPVIQSTVPKEDYDALLARVEALEGSASPSIDAIITDPAGDPPIEADIKKMNRDELVAHAAMLNVSHAEDATKAQIKEAIMTPPVAQGQE